MPAGATLASRRAAAAEGLRAGIEAALASLRGRRGTGLLLPLVQEPAEVQTLGSVLRRTGGGHRRLPGQETQGREQDEDPSHALHYRPRPGRKSTIDPVSFSCPDPPVAR